MESERKVLTVKEVAEKLGICSALVRRQIKKGVIPCVKLGDRYLIPKVAFERWLTLERSEHSEHISATSRNFPSNVQPGNPNE